MWLHYGNWWTPFAAYIIHENVDTLLHSQIAAPSAGREYTLIKKNQGYKYDKLQYKAPSKRAMWDGL